MKVCAAPLQKINSVHYKSYSCGSGHHCYGFLPENLVSYPQKGQKGRDTVPYSEIILILRFIATICISVCYSDVAQVLNKSSSFDEVLAARSVV